MSGQPFTHVGKQVLSGSDHYADAVNERAASIIAHSLNIRASLLRRPASPNRETRG